MSLNGLDATDVNEAYISALGEGGGWFLLQYTSRAEVGLLKKGSGGIPEVKETVAQYVERSPLYGFLHYRRRKVLLKHVPEGTSRLLQARLAVHSQSIAEKFSPYDTVFLFTTAAELVDSALSAACSLHTAPASIKSSTSLRQKGLAGITEDACERHSTVVPSSGAAEENGESLVTQLDMTRPDGQHNNACPSPPRQNASPAPSSQTIFNTDKALPPTPDSLNQNERPKRSTDRDEFQVRASFEGRHSSQSARPSTREGYSAYEFKPKVKLGPRPSLDNDTGTPNSDRTSRAYDPRPVSTLPASVRMPARKAMPARPTSPRRETPPTSQPGPASKPSAVSSTISSKSSVSSTPTVVLEQPAMKPTSTIHPRLLNAEPKTPTMTPEKKRLMKALELRQKQMAAQKKAQNNKLDGIDARSQSNTATKPGEDEVLVRSSLEAAEVPENPDMLQTAMRVEDLGIVHLGAADLVRSNCANLDASPISVPGTSDGTSTQASSVSGDEPCHIDNGKIDYYVRPNPDEKLQATEGAGLLEQLEENAENTVQTPFQHHPRAVEVSGKPDLELKPQAESSGRQTEMVPQKPDLADEDTYPEPNEGICVTLHEKAVQSTGTTTTEPNAELSTTNEKAVTVYSPALVQQENLPSSPGIIRHGSDEIFPHKIPLPAISGDEEMLLNPPGVSELNQPDPPALEKTWSTPQITSDRLDEDCQTVNNHHSPATGFSTADTIAEKGECARLYQRHGLVEPLRRLSSGENSDDQFLSDDSFMEELKGATVQEAKPISVSKSPITPVFPNAASEQRRESTALRSVSSPLVSKGTRDSNISTQSSTLLTPRSISASKPRSTSPSDIATPMLGKVGVSSGISQRIKALEKLSSKPSSPLQPNSSPVSTTPAITSLSSRKTSFRSRPGNSDPPRSRQARLSPSPILSPTTSFENSHPKPYNQFISVNMASKPGKSRPESISVTARIVRDERNLNPEVPRDASEPCIMDLHHSPLKVEHRPADPVSLSKKPPILRHTTAPSVSSNNTEPAPSPRRDSIASGSNGSRRGSDVGLPRSASEVSLSGINNGDPAKEEKKESRKSRLLKRMSNSMAASRRSIATALSPPLVREESIAEHNELPQEIRPAVVEIGDVNIQFPDTLLWKRRHMLIDAQGTLVLSASKTDSNSRVATKRYPLTDFFAPYIPDQDRQEMPNSVNLDFRDGSTLQFKVNTSRIWKGPGTVPRQRPVLVSVALTVMIGIQGVEDITVSLSVILSTHSDHICVMHSSLRAPMLFKAHRKSLYSTSSYNTPKTIISSAAEILSAESYCSNLLQKYDSPSYTLRAFIPRHAQPAYLAIRAFNLEIARIADAVSTSHVGALRLQFWRDNVNAAFAGRPPKQPVAVLLAHVLDGLSASATSGKPPLSRAWFLRVIDAREKYLNNAPYPDLAALEAYAESTYSTLLYLTLQALPLHSIALDHLASHIGKASGIVAVLRGLPLLAFPPPPNHHSNSAGLSPAVEAQRSGSRQGAVTLPLDVMAEAGVREEDVLRKGAEAEGLRDAVFKVAIRASDHLITARSMLRQLQKGEAVDHAFEGEIEEERQDYAGEGNGKGQSEVERGFGVLMPAVSTGLWLKRLEKVDFDIFQEDLRKREWTLPWKAYWGYTRRRF